MGQCQPSGWINEYFSYLDVGLASCFVYSVIAMCTFSTKTPNGTVDPVPLENGSG